VGRVDCSSSKNRVASFGDTSASILARTFSKSAIFKRIKIVC
jgi:hypothetical protein